MKKMNLLKIAVAIALLFAVNMDANAQFGKLKSLAKKAKEAVTEKVETTTTVASDDDDNDQPTTSQQSNSKKAKAGYDEDGSPVRMEGESEEAFRIRNQRYFYKDNPTKLEQLDVQEAGSVRNYLGITGGDEAVIMKYYELKPGDLKTANRGDENGYWAAQMIVNAWRYIKNPAADTGYIDDPATFKRDFIHNDIEKKDAKTIEYVKLAIKPFQNYKLMPKSDYDAFMRMIKKTVADYEAKYGSVK